MTSPIIFRVKRSDSYGKDPLARGGLSFYRLSMKSRDSPSHGLSRGGGVVNRHAIIRSNCKTSLSIEGNAAAGRFLALGDSGTTRPAVLACIRSGETPPHRSEVPVTSILIVERSKEIARSGVPLLCVICPDDSCESGSPELLVRWLHRLPCSAIGKELPGFATS